MCYSYVYAFQFHFYEHLLLMSISKRSFLENQLIGLTPLIRMKTNEKLPFLD